MTLGGLRLPGPKSLGGQLALLVGVALFVAQAINFALLLGERRERRVNQFVAPAVVRIVDAIERDAGAPPRRPRRGMRRVEIGAVSAVTREMTRQPVVEARIADALLQAGVPTLAVQAAETRATARDTMRRPRRNPARTRLDRTRPDRILLVSVQRAPDQWLTLRVPVRGSDGAAAWRLLGQTAILYIVLMIAVLWIGRRVARPLHDLAEAASAFGRSSTPEPLAERGPADIRQLTAAFNAMRDRLAAMLTEKDRMLGAIGHDLRTPLASLRLRIETVDDADARARMIDTVAEMNQTLDDILSLAQVGRSSEPVARVDLAALVDAIVEDLRDLGGDIAFEPSPRVALDLRPVLTRRAIRNLAENAIKYGAGSVVRVRREGDQAIVEIDDEGPGLPADSLDAVFDSFTRIETSRNRDTGGAGLGLALARAIVRDQGGDIALRNRATGGLRATLRFPLAQG